MKKFYILFALISGLLINSSCSNNDDDNEVELSVIGGWTVAESKLNGDIVTDQSFTRLLTANHRTEWFFDGFGDFEGIISVQGSWQLNGNTLTIDFDDSAMGTKIYTVTNIQPSSMTWESEITGEGTLKELLKR